MARTRRSYDHRLRDLVRDTGDVTIATRLGVPRADAGELYVGTGANVPDDLERQRAVAKQARFEVSRALTRRMCAETAVDPAAA